MPLVHGTRQGYSCAEGGDDMAAADHPEHTRMLSGEGDEGRGGLPASCRTRNLGALFQTLYKTLHLMALERVELLMPFTCHVPITGPRKLLVVPVPPLDVCWRSAAHQYLLAR